MRAGVLDATAIRRARERCLATGEIRPDLRAPIRFSWLRSRSGAVPREPSFRIETDLDVDTRLCRAARPVFDRLATRLADTRTSLFLANERAVLVRRWADTPDLVRRLDRACSVPGAVLAEADVGTNGVGTVAETGEPLSVSGPEHWGEGYQALACAGAPIRNRVTGRIAGVLTVTSPREDGHPALLALAAEAATEIEAELVALASQKERALLDAFLTATRRPSQAILAASGRLVITTPAAARVLERIDQSLLWERIAGAERTGRPSALVLEQDGGAIEVRLRPQADGTEGVVAEFRPARPSARSAAAGQASTLVGWVGEHPATLAAARAARSAVVAGRGIVVHGEPGVGKLALVQAAWAERGESVQVLDAALEGADGNAAWLRALRDALHGPSPVTLRHAELLGARAARAIAALVDDVGSARLAITVTGGVVDLPPAVRSLVVRVAPQPIELLPLRHRAEDLRALVAHFAQGRRRFGSDAMQVVRRQSWPDNVRELRQLVEETCASGHGEVRTAELPPRLRTRSAQRRMTRIEEVELSALLSALRESGGNKSRAAELLGVSRSTVYRKLEASGVDLDARAW